MDEQKSIFQSELSAESNNHILSASKWAKFLGIAFLIFSGFFLIMALVLAFSWEQIADGLEMAMASNPALSTFENLPQIAIIIVVLIAIGFFIFLGLLLLKIGKNGADYYSSHDEGAFISMFQSAKTYFLIYAIFTIISIASSFFGLIGGLF